jgi:sugar O-acyltransferase (sialic acid O-acetyltransferase NeuD family)
MKKPLLIYGAGGLGREIFSFVKTLDEWQVTGFIDDAQPKGKRVSGLEVIGNMELLNSLDYPVNVVLAFGDPKIKEAVSGKIINDNVRFPVLIHPRAILQEVESIAIGEGSVICAGTVLTTNITLGKHVLINLNSTIGHDVMIGDYSCVMTGINIAGGVHIGESVLIGSGVNIRNLVRIGNGSTVGMGSVVISDVVENNVVAGIPAKSILK